MERSVIGGTLSEDSMSQQSDNTMTASELEILAGDMDPKEYLIQNMKIQLKAFKILARQRHQVMYAKYRDVDKNLVQEYIFN